MKNQKKLDNNKNIDILDSQIKRMLANKKNKSKFHRMPDGLPLKSYGALYDLEENHDNSWAVEIFLENKKNMNNVALLYRGRKISYSEMFSKVYDYASSFKSLGIKKGDEIPVFVSNTPEYVYTLLALNLIGVVTNTVGTWFDEKYLQKIFENSKSKYILISDDNYKIAKNPIERANNLQKVIMVSITDSLLTDKNGKKINPYQELDDKFHDFSNKVDECKKDCSKEIISQAEFLKFGSNYKENLVEDMVLDDLAMITYTSGTTTPGYPKGCNHSNRNYLAISRIKKPDVFDMPAMNNFSVLAHLPSYTQTVLTTSYSDPLYLGYTIALEPFIEGKFFPYSLIINKPNYTVETPGLFLELAKKLNYDPEWKNVKMEYLMLPTLVGEETSLGEEKYLNYTSRKHKFGKAKMPISTVMSFGGGSTENGGVLFTFFKSFQEKRLKYLFKKDHLHLQIFPIAQMEVLRPDGTYCDIDEPGLLVDISPCNQIGYVNSEFNDGMNITDANGKIWYSCGTYAIKDKFGGIRMVGRPKSNIKTDDGRSIPLYQIKDLIDADTKNILTTEIVQVSDNGVPVYVCHIEKQPESKITDERLLQQCIMRLKSKFDDQILEKMYFRVRTYNESFPLAPSQKRNKDILIQEGLNEKTIPFNQINNKQTDTIIKKMSL